MIDMMLLSMWNLRQRLVENAKLGSTFGCVKCMGGVSHRAITPCVKLNASFHEFFGILT